MTLDAEGFSDPPAMAPQITYTGHKDRLKIARTFFPDLKLEDLPDQEFAASEDLRLTTHNGTHLDAPWHFHSTMDNGKPSLTIDEVPLEWCYQPGVKLDLRHLEDGQVATPDDIDAALKVIDHELKPLEIVLINTRAGARHGLPDYIDSGCGLGYDATIHLLKQGVKLTGTDAWSWDAPFSHTAKRYAQTKDPSIIWEGHKASRHMGYCHLEKLQNLEALPAKGFIVACFPVKIRRASAGWTRAVAILDSE
jgi:kynurenine formamidase